MNKKDLENNAVYRAIRVSYFIGLAFSAFLLYWFSGYPGSGGLTIAFVGALLSWISKKSLIYICFGKIEQ